MALRGEASESEERPGSRSRDRLAVFQGTAVKSLQGEAVNQPVASQIHQQSVMP
jgi:hypothetical protein